MEILVLSLKNFKLYSPSTGELIYDSLNNHLNEGAKSLIGCWHFDSDELSDYYGDRLVEDHVQSFLSGITTYHPELFRDWEHYLINCSHQAMDREDHCRVNIEEFIRDYDKFPTWLCFKIEDTNNQWGYKYFVLDMNGTANLLE